MSQINYTFDSNRVLLETLMCANICFDYSFLARQTGQAEAGQTGISRQDEAGANRRAGMGRQGRWQTWIGSKVK